MKKFPVISANQMYSKMFMEFPNTASTVLDSIDMRDIKIKLNKTSNSLEVEAKMGASGKLYKTEVKIFEVEYSEKRTPVTPTELSTKNGMYWIAPVLEPKVQFFCQCADYRHRWAWANYKFNLYLGTRPKSYTPVPGSKRPPVNPKGVAGTCKHCSKLLKALDESDIIKLNVRL